MTKNILVAYTSKYGSTRKYAEWIAAELDADLLSAQNVTSHVLEQYHIIIYGGGLYAGGIAGVKLVTQNPCKNLIVFTVGLADPAETDYSDIINKNFTPELYQNTKFFHLRGGIDYQKLGPVHKIMMAMMKATIQRMTESERQSHKEFLDTYNKQVYFEDKNTIASIITYVKSI